jgi:ribosome biogenesis protein MAK21
MKVQSSLQYENYMDFEALETLMGLAERQNRREAEAAIIAAKELFADHILPNYPLKPLSQVSENNLRLTFESKLKAAYSRYLTILSHQLSNTVPHFKQQVIQLLSDLAALKPEGRDQIIGLLVNKLGDPDTVVPTSVVLEVTHLVRRRRFLLEAVVREIGAFVFRKQQSHKGKFYAVVLLNAIKVREGEQAAIRGMVQICLKLFPNLQEEAQHTKTLALLLQAANKLFAAYSGKSDLDFFSQEMDSLYRLSHLQTNQIVQLQALRFIFQAEKALGTVSDRYYRTLYDHVLPHPRLRDVNPKTLSIFFNTLLISLREDTVLSRVQAFLKRMLMCCLVTDTPFVCGMLLIVAEVLQVHKGAWTMITTKPDGEEEEQYFDIPDSEDERPAAVSTAPVPVSKPQFDPLKREPRYSGGNLACLYELNILAVHFHPTVRKWAKSLLLQQPFNYDSDPLLDFSMVNFLERFSYQSPKPKLVAKLQGRRVRMSLIQEAVNSETFAKMDDSAVREDELFFKHYFRLKKKPEIEAKTDSEEEGSEEMEEEEDGESEGEEEAFNFSDIEDEGGEDVGDLEEEDKPGKKRKLPTFADSEEYQHLLR